MISVANGQHSLVEIPVTKRFERLRATHATLLENRCTREGTGGSNPPLSAPDLTEQVLNGVSASPKRPWLRVGSVGSNLVASGPHRDKELCLVRTNPNPRGEVGSEVAQAAPHPRGIEEA